MKRGETTPRNNRWATDGARPGVQSGRNLGYVVVTARKRTEHDRFDDAAEEYWRRRVGLSLFARQESLTTSVRVAHRLVDE